MKRFDQKAGTDTGQRNSPGIFATLGAAGLLGLLVLAHLWQTPENPNLLQRTLQNALHIPAFTVLSCFVALVFRTWRSWQVGLVCLGVAVLLEASQVLSSRDASLMDLAADVLGILLGLFIARGKVGLKLAAVAVLILATTWSPFQVWIWYEHRDAKFPVLLDDSFLDAPLFESASLVERSDGGYLRICLADEEYPGVRVEEPRPDWRAHDTLEVQFAVEGDTAIRMTVAVSYVGTPGTSAYVIERFEPGVHRWEVPVAELLAADADALISRFNLHSFREHAGQCLLLSSITLR